MKQLRIFVDVAMGPDALKMLRDGAAGHELIFPRTPISSVLAMTGPDPQFAAADVTFGQPDPQAIAQASQLKWIHISSSGITRYDTTEFRALAAERKLAVSNSATVYAEACAAHALSFVLAQARQLPAALGGRLAGGSEPWQRLRNACSTLRGETVLLVGYGAIGKRLAELLRPFGVHLLAFRRQRRGDEEVPVVVQAELTGVLGQADHVIDLLPGSGQTHHFFDRARFASMKPGAAFYNIGRGATVDQEALLEGLLSKRLGAAWLDVTEPEPLPQAHPLWKAPNCFITPHIAGGQPEETKALVRHFLDNLGRFGRGDPLLDQVM